MKELLRSAFIAAGLVSWITTARAADWPNWRGPNHNGISMETGWSAKWPADGPTELWRASIGIGFSSIVVANGKAYAMGNQSDTDTVYCFDAATGKQAWKFSYPCKLDAHFYEGGPLATPSVDGNRVFTMSKEGALYCLDANAGTVVWTKNVPKEVGAASPTWGFAGSPLVQDDLIILDVGGHGTALEKATGKIVWTSDKETCGYSTPVPCSFNGTAAVAILSQKAAFGVETKTGKKLWSFPWETYSDINAADVIVSGDEIFVSAGYDHGGSVGRIAGNSTSRVWENRTMRNQINSCVLVDGYLYGVDGSAYGGEPATLKCVDFTTGSEKWDYSGLGGGALMEADHKLIVISDKGELLVAPVSPDGFHPICRAQVLGGKCWTVPTLANGRIYCRNAAGSLVCLDVRGN